MDDNRILRLIDSSYKVCEVTGRDMGGDYTLEIPVADLSIGYVKWPSSYKPDHGVNSVEIDEKYIKLEVIYISRQSRDSYTLYVGDKKSVNYMFGEWSYGYTISVENR